MVSMPAVTGILETALYVEDLESSVQFYKDLFGFDILQSDEHRVALNVGNRNVLLLFQKGRSVTPTNVPGGSVPAHDAGGAIHIAFAITEEALPDWEQQLAERSIPIESRVALEQGQCIYFRDPDYHLIKLVTPGMWPIY